MKKLLLIFVLFFSATTLCNAQSNEPIFVSKDGYTTFVTYDYGQSYKETSFFDVLCSTGQLGIGTGSAVVRFNGMIFTIKWRPNYTLQTMPSGTLFYVPLKPEYNEVNYGESLWSTTAGGRC